VEWIVSAFLEEEWDYEYHWTASGATVVAADEHCLRHYFRTLAENGF
jgi:hypothetical protein